ncbi:MAG: hypothetical protein HQM08_19875 [Candidatus Riflebacteria bacterium]|nr:hypothetical protein [Candidatus Riflebacteria bacterium]
MGDEQTAAPPKGAIYAGDWISERRCAKAVDEPVSLQLQVTSSLNVAFRAGGDLPCSKKSDNGKLDCPDRAIGTTSWTAGTSNLRSKVGQSDLPSEGWM